MHGTETGALYLKYEMNDPHQLLCFDNQFPAGDAILGKCETSREHET